MAEPKTRGAVKKTGVAPKSGRARQATSAIFELTQCEHKDAKLVGGAAWWCDHCGAIRIGGHEVVNLQTVQRRPCGELPWIHPTILLRFVNRD